MSAGSENAMNVAEHFAGIKGMLQHVGENGDVVLFLGHKVVDEAGVHGEASRASGGGGGLVDLEAFEFAEAVAREEAKAAAFIAADVEQATVAGAMMESDIAVNFCEPAIQS